MLPADDSIESPKPDNGGIIQVLNCINGANTRNIQNGENCANGGLATDAWRWAHWNGGVTSESQLPYLAGKTFGSYRKSCLVARAFRS